MKRIATYCRISTASQDDAMQTAELSRYCEARGMEIVRQFSDTASGSKQDRKGMLALMTACRRREVDAVVVYRFDRFARSLKQLVDALAEFQALGIEFISIHESLDTSTPQGRMVFGIFASLAEFEKEIIRERVKSGLDQARRKGKHLGRKFQFRHKREEVMKQWAMGNSLAESAADLHMSRSSVARLRHEGNQQLQHQ